MTRDACGDEAWVRRVNQSWITHGELAARAEQYLDHLVQTDPARLERTIAAVRHLMDARDHVTDPKPRFYGGLFCLANVEEGERFTPTGSLTRFLMPSISSPPPPVADEKTRRRFERLRREIEQVSLDFGGTG